jgi:hypothetical protein
MDSRCFTNARRNSRERFAKVKKLTISVPIV